MRTTTFIAPWLRIATALGAAVFLTACSEDGTTTTPPEVTGVTISAPATSVEVGATLQLQASVQPSGVSQSVVWSSGDEDLATVDAASGLVEGIFPGMVTITATSTEDAGHSDSIELTVTGCPAPRMVTSDINADTTWEDWIPSPECFDYIVTTDLDPNEAILVIEPGAVIGFEEGTRLRVVGEAGLIAAGTEQNPIRLTGTEAVRGHWDGVLLHGTDYVDNVIEHVTIEYGGSGNFGGGIESANLMLDDVTTTLGSTTLMESAGYGLYMDFNSTLAAPSGGLTASGNASGPAYVYASGVSDLVQDPAPSLTGNDRDVLDVFPDELEGGHAWPDIGIPYRILEANRKDAFEISGDLSLTGGVVIEFEQDMAIRVRGGNLTAVGSEESPILLTGTSQEPGHWQGLGLQDTDSQLDHVVIEYGGGDIIGLGSQEPANLQLTTGSAEISTVVTVTNTTLRHSPAYGLYARSIGVVLDEFSNNVLTGNGLGAAYVDAPLAQHLGEGTYTGNGIERIHVNTSSRPLDSGDATWEDRGVPYVLVQGASASTFIVDEVSFTIAPGVEVQFGAGMGLQVRSGELTIVGTETDPILLRAEDDAWRGIHVFESQGALDHVSIVGAGSSQWGGMQEAAAVSIGSSGASAFVAIGSSASASSVSDFGLVFSYGPTVAIMCGWLAPYHIPTGDSGVEHCPNG